MSETALIDIVEPVAPVVQTELVWMWLVAGMLPILLVAGIFFWWKYKLPAWRALKLIRTLQRQMHAGEHTVHEAVLRLALELRHALGVKRLHGERLPPQIGAYDHARWQEFMQQLDGMLYRHEGELLKTQVDALYLLAEYWIKRYARHSRLRKLDL